AGPWAMVAVENEVLDRVLPGGLGGGLDQQMFGLCGIGRRGLRAIEQLDGDGHLAELDDVARLDFFLTRTETNAVEECAVGTAEIADAPAVVGVQHLGMAPADGTVVQHHLQGRQTTGPEQVVRFPDLAFDLAIDSPQADALLHARLPRTLRPAPLP